MSGPRVYLERRRTLRDIEGWTFRELREFKRRMKRFGVVSHLPYKRRMA